ncbi:hypothetical protein LXL04_038341 [Taraxacum kok-saghyz]
MERIEATELKWNRMWYGESLIRVLSRKLRGSLWKEKGSGSKALSPLLFTSPLTFKPFLDAIARQREIPDLLSQISTFGCPLPNLDLQQPLQPIGWLQPPTNLRCEHTRTIADSRNPESPADHLLFSFCEHRRVEASPAIPAPPRHPLRTISSSDSFRSLLFIFESSSRCKEGVQRSSEDRFKLRRLVREKQLPIPICSAFCLLPAISQVIRFDSAVSATQQGLFCFKGLLDRSYLIHLNSFESKSGQMEDAGTNGRSPGQMEVSGTNGQIKS